MPWDGRLLPDEPDYQDNPVDPFHPAAMNDQTSPTLAPSLSELFDDDPPLLPNPAEGNPAVPAPGTGDGLLTEDISPGPWQGGYLMDDPPYAQRNIPAAPVIENWQSMNRNQEENTHV
jgi:hypothetical protein